MGTQICKQGPTSTFDEIKAVVVQYAVTLTETQAENEAFHEISVMVPMIEEQECEMVVKTRRNDIGKIDVFSIREQGKNISRGFKVMDWKNSLNRTLDIGVLEKGILRQIERKNIEGR
jgi:hypothetical protein